ncbi:MAG: MmcQ/YjbR family DNA-binding protein [Gammaproteobacteria bacterium]|nr:MmcQ/YjbR family DNA-binding protein [Gammaproteobacteria bacterium]MBU1489232.1 MmcQ/YjbR family DNA-binding protein [Gammaproteobacteria bacterium]MBU2065335.1 MmcQ/YjbR family DNA-binding protein [Gammaproteobacteria bacterium]MBU2139710.1 MmcQ/YjbR family DNA-binding protein [Gammaproteobacteria bacterium]MBU2216006.1 MmcQ/YjbR family DNA-binding protein [Gammaproteobacteria bacterium]
MTRDELEHYCLALPGVQLDLKWRGMRVFSVAGNRMFAMIDPYRDSLSFKVEHASFLAHTDRPGIRPAPYLARAHWISMAASQPPLADSELRALLLAAHQLVVRRLPRYRQVSLLLEQGSGEQRL